MHFLPLFALAFVVSSPALAFERINESTAGVQANDEGFFSQISANGRYVIFESRSTNLVQVDTNFVGDVFLHDRQLQTTERLSLTDGGAQALGGISTDPHLSADMSSATFSSRATNLVAGDLNGDTDTFVRDLASGAVTRISVHTNGTEGNAASRPHDLSADGRYVVFQSWATNLVDSDTNTTPDMFVRDRVTGTTERVNVSSSGAEGNQGQVPDTFMGAGSIDADGRYVSFASIASDLVANDDNDATDVFLRDRTLGETRRISVSASGVEGNGDSRWAKISADGLFIAIGSLANNLVAVDDNIFTADIFLVDLTTGAVTLVNRNSLGVQSVNNILHDLSDDGRFVVWSTTTTNLIPGDPATAPNVADIFVWDRTTSEIARVTAGADTSASSSRATISGAGSSIAFRSADSTLVPDDTNMLADYFVVQNPLQAPAVPSLSGWLYGVLALSVMAVGSVSRRRLEPAGHRERAG